MTTVHIRCTCRLLILTLMILRCNKKDALYTSVQYRNRKLAAIVSSDSGRKAFIVNKNATAILLRSGKDDSRKWIIKAGNLRLYSI